MLSGCHRPPADDGREPLNVPSAAITTPSPTATPTPEPADLSLGAAVAKILLTADRTGGVIDRAQCGTRGTLVPIHLLPPSLKVEPMDEALRQITQQFPEILWKSSAHGHVTVKDSSVHGSLLQVRLKEFFVIEDRPPQAALAALWQADEVMAYMKKNHVRAARHTDLSTAAGKSAPKVIHMKNATVQEILDRIVESYAGGGESSQHNVWVYRECHAGGETFAEVRVM